MKEFFVGLLVLLLVSVLSVVGVLLLPLLFVLGFFIRWILIFVLLMFAIWVVGKVTLILIDLVKKK